MSTKRRIRDGEIDTMNIEMVAGHLEDASLEQIAWLIREGAFDQDSGIDTSHKITDLPLVGDADPDALADRTDYPVWTWDETHAIVGEGTDDLRIVPIDDLQDRDAEPEDSAAYYAAENLAQTLGATIDEDPVYTPDDGAHAYGFQLTQKPTKPSPQTTVQTLGRHDDLRLAVQVDAAGGEDPTGNYSMVPVHIETGPLDDPEILETVEVRWAEL